MLNAFFPLVFDCLRRQFTSSAGPDRTVHDRKLNTILRSRSCPNLCRDKLESEGNPNSIIVSVITLCANWTTHCVSLWSKLTRMIWMYLWGDGDWVMMNEDFFLFWFSSDWYQFYLTTIFIYILQFKFEIVSTPYMYVFGKSVVSCLFKVYYVFFFL